jgi:DNA-binding CsgD family transcriptional regulator
MAMCTRRGGISSRLTPKEREVVQYLVSGLTVKEIAERTGRHPSTIYEHLDRIRLRLGLRTVPEIAIYAVRHNLVSFPSDLDASPSISEEGTQAR